MNRQEEIKLIHPAQGEREPPTWIFYGSQLPDAGRGRMSKGKKWNKPPCDWHLLPNIRSGGQHLDLDRGSMRQEEWASLNAKTNKWSIYWNKLSFSSLTGYQFPVCCWHRCHGDFLYQAVCSPLKLLRWQKAIIPSRLVEMAWCAMMWSSFLIPLFLRAHLTLWSS